MIAIDFGVDAKLCWYGDYGPMPIPRSSRGGSDAQKFLESLGRALARDDVVTESATVGSSGAEPEQVRKLVAMFSEHILFTIPTRTAKNYLGRPVASDEEAARTIHEVATKNPAALTRWSYVASADKLRRKHTSVRPHDKRGYSTLEVRRWMDNLPRFSYLPVSVRKWFTDGKFPAYYRPAAVLPFAMAFEEVGAWESRRQYEKIIGLYGHGYPSFYRRATVVLMQNIAKTTTGKAHNVEITKDERKAAWRSARQVIRQLYALSVAHRSGTTHPETGTMDPGECVADFLPSGNNHPETGTSDPDGSPLSPGTTNPETGTRYPGEAALIVQPTLELW